MAKTNTLTSHTPERQNNPVGKMSPTRKKPKSSWFRSFLDGKSKKFEKKFANKKRRQFLNNIDNDKI